MAETAGETIANTMADVYIGLGSNMDGPQDQLHRALESLAAEPQIELVAVSALVVILRCRGQRPLLSSTLILTMPMKRHNIRLE